MGKPQSDPTLDAIKDYYADNYTYSVQLDTIYGAHGGGDQAGPIQPSGPDDRFSSFYSLSNADQKASAWPFPGGEKKSNETQPMRYFESRVKAGDELTVEFADFSFDHSFIYNGVQYHEVWNVTQMVVRGWTEGYYGDPVD